MNNVPIKKVWWPVLLLACLFIQAAAQTLPEERLLQEAKVLLFDEKWKEAAEKLDALLQKYPKSGLVSQALFYRGRCLAKVEGRQEEAMDSFQDYLRSKDRNKNLIEESEVAIIDLASELYDRGRRKALDEIVSRLSSSNKVVRYYAAFKLSYFEDKDIAGRSVPVLRSIVEGEKDSELQDRAKIALMRVDPQELKKIEDRGSERRGRLLRIVITEAGEEKIRVNIPWALADLAIQAIPSSEKMMLREKGYDLERIFRELEKTKTSIVEILEDDVSIKIWID